MSDHKLRDDLLSVYESKERTENIYPKIAFRTDIHNVSQAYPVLHLSLPKIH
jgi:hypothetical protein